MTNTSTIEWTNESVLAFAKDSDPFKAIENAARELVLRARENGWEGPPFNPIRIAEMLGVRIEANSGVADARLVATDTGPKIEFNPQQPRERVRFSIAHEVAHILFSDWHKQDRNRGGQRDVADDWQLEMLCNLAASEFVLPVGSLPAGTTIPSIEELMIERRQFDVSAEAFLIRLAKISIPPIGVFFAAPHISGDKRHYSVNYFVSSPTAPKIQLAGRAIPSESIIQRCVAIGHTDSAIENWIVGTPTQIECVGIPGYPGAVYPRVAGLIRFDTRQKDRKPIRFVHGDILEPRERGKKIVCQLVNDRARKWGGGIARKMAQKYPEAEAHFQRQLDSIPPNQRLGQVLFSTASDDVTIASLVAQEGFGRSPRPRIRYGALERCLVAIAEYAKDAHASIHMPKIGTGAAGGDWGTIEELIDDVVVRAGVSVIVYELPPPRAQLELI